MRDLKNERLSNACAVQAELRAFGAHTNRLCLGVGAEAAAFAGAAFALAGRDGGTEAGGVAVVSATAGAVSSPLSSPLSFSEPEPSPASFSNCRVRTDQQIIILN